MENIFTDGRLPLENNRAERGLRGFVVGRKASLFSDTQRGATASAAMYSIITTARANALNTYRYLAWVLAELPTRADAMGRVEKDVLENFLPWSPGVPSSCRMTSTELGAPNPIDEPIVDIDPYQLDED